MTKLPFPEALRRDLVSGRPLSVEQRARLRALVKGVEKPKLKNDPFPNLYNLDGIRREHGFWTCKVVNLYLGKESAIYKPGNIDPHLAIIIGQAEPDSPIVLDYRVSPPRVVYFAGVGNESYWIEICPDYESLAAAIALTR